MRGPARQRGASAVFVAISMVASVAALGMSLDLGRLYFTHRDLQLLADMAALDAARSAGGCLGQTDDPHGAAAGEAAASMQRNGASLAYLTAGAVEIGREVTVGGVRGFVPDGSTRADSVKVTLRRPLPNKLIPLFSSGSGGVMSASAAATLRPIVSLDVGSSLADINPRVLNSALGGMFGNPDLALSLGSYTGLFSASVSLGDLAAAANAGSVEDFLDAQTTAPDLLNAIAGALGSGSDAAVRTTLEAIASGSDTSRTVVPRQVLGVPAGATADDALVGVGALVTALAQSANGDNLVDLSLPVDLPTIGNVDVKLRLIELARPAIGPPTTDAAGNPQTFANTAQALLQADISLGKVLNSPVKLSVYAQFGDASAAVTDLHCAQRGRPQAVVAVNARSGVGGLGIGRFDISASTPPSLPLEEALPIVDLRPVGIPVQIVASAYGEINSGEEAALLFEGPFPAAPQTIGTDATTALTNAINDASHSIDVHAEPDIAGLAQIERLAVESAVAQLKPQIAMVLGRLNDQLLAPLAQVLGANAGSARIQVRSVVAQQPVLYAR